MSQLTEQIEKIILSALPDANVEVTDPMNDGAHLEAAVVSASFEGLSLVEQHRKVMQALKAEFAGDLHALKLKTRVPETTNGEEG